MIKKITLFSAVALSLLAAGPVLAANGLQTTGKYILKVYNNTGHKLRMLAFAKSGTPAPLAKKRCTRFGGCVLYSSNYGRRFKINKAIVGQSPVTDHSISFSSKNDQGLYWLIRLLPGSTPFVNSMLLNDDSALSFKQQQQQQYSEVLVYLCTSTYYKSHKDSCE